MFSLRPYHSLKEEEDSPYGKSALYSCTEDNITTIVTCSNSSTTTPASSIICTTSTITTTTTTNTTPLTSTATTVSSGTSTGTFVAVSSTPFSNSVSAIITTSSPPPKSSSPSSSASTFSSPFTLQSIKAAWRSLTSISFTSTRLPHLEREESTTSDPHQHDYRYTQFPTSLNTPTANTNKRQKESTFHHTHLHISPSIRTYTHPHRTPIHPLAPASSEPLTLVKCLRKHREKQQARALSRKSKSDNALQRIGVNNKCNSDQNLHKVCIIGGNGHTATHPNSIFSNVHLSGGSGDSCGSFCSSSSNSSRYHYPVRYTSSTSQRFPNRSRSLERGHANRIHHHWTRESFSIQRHTRSLERNHKFRIDLRHLSSSLAVRDQPPDHPAPPPPISSFHTKESNRQHTLTNILTGFDATDGSGGSLSLCSTTSSSSSTSSCGGSLYRVNMESSNVSGSFINKPPRGWLHPDQQLAEEGICYGVRYIGALEINTSMKSLNFDTRSLIAKECISKVCEAAGLKTADRKRKVVKSIGRILGERPLMEHAGSNITLTITSTSLTLTTLESCQVVACHEMPNISFASGGDPDTLDFIAYVAKDSRYGRACFVLECGGGLAQDVITTIGQAFELRFKEYLKRTPASVQYTNVKPDSRTPINGELPSWTPREKDDREYYNDLPGKVPPEPKPPPVPPLPQYSTSSNNLSATLPSASLTSTMSAASSNITSHSHTSTTSVMTPNIQNSIFHQTPSAANNFAPQQSANTQRASTDNLIDLMSDASVCPSSMTNTATTITRPTAEPEYVNDAIIKQRHHHHHHPANEGLKDPFDMQPFSMQLNQLTSSGQSNSTASKPLDMMTSSSGPAKTLPLNQRLEIQQELWFHGPISRKEAEQLMKQDGDFLVRESQGTAGQYVLTGMQNSTKKHLLLVDPEGVVRTKSRTFDSVSHLINYHRNNELPIVSAESALVLRNPVIRQH